jgi:hypothetical protein
MALEQEQEFGHLRLENAELRALLARVQAQLTDALVRIAALDALVNQRGDPPAFVKRNRKEAEGEPPPRKKRAAAHRGHQAATPTRIQRHVLKRCPRGLQLPAERGEHRVHT